jgi:hypothetical protein
MPSRLNHAARLSVVLVIVLLIVLGLGSRVWGLGFEA